jgi:Caspase domain
MKNFLLVFTAFCLFFVQTAFTSNLLSVDDVTKRTLVLSVGVGKYNNLKIDDLTYPSYDASSLLWKIKSMSRNEIIYAKPLYDSEATKQNLRRELDRIAKTAKENDVIIVYISGHGIFSFALLYMDEQISYDEINAILSVSKCKNIFVILDVCHSGSSIVDIAKYKKVVFICACMDSELSYELSVLKHGLFTYHIITGLSGIADINGDSVITIKELFVYAATNTKNQALYGNLVQNPVMTDTFDRPILYIKKE